MMMTNNSIKDILRIAFFIILLLSYSIVSLAEKANSPFKGFFYEKNEKINLQLDLYEKSLIVPGMEFLGEVNGYMQGNIYGIWMLTSHKIKGNVATLRFSNDLGADAQTIILTQINDSTFVYKAVGGNNIKRVHKKKLVKIPTELIFTKNKKVIE